VRRENNGGKISHGEKKAGLISFDSRLGQCRGKKDCEERQTIASYVSFIQVERVGIRGLMRTNRYGGTRVVIRSLDRRITRKGEKEGLKKNTTTPEPR